MLEAVLEHIHNWFERGRLRGPFAVEGGVIGLPDGFLADGQYFRIVGSVFNDGLHCWPASGLEDEQFVGEVRALAIPLALIEVVDDIERWQQAHQAELEGPYKSESFGGYTYQLKDGIDSPDAWKTQFRGQLNRWRKL